MEDAGFAEVTIRPLEIPRRHDGFEDFWEVTLDLSRSFHDVVMDQPEATIAQIHDELAARMEPFADPTGKLDVPTRTLVLRAEA